METQSYNGEAGTLVYSGQDAHVTIAASQGALVRGQLLGRKTTDDGKFYKYVSTNSDGTEKPVAVLLVDVPASASDQKACTLVYGSVEYANLKGMTDHESATERKAVETSLLDSKIVVKEAV